MNLSKELSLDLAHHQGGDVIRIHEGDHNSSSFLINVYNRGTAFSLTGKTVKYDATIAGYLAENDANGTVDENTITIPITPNMTALPGKLLVDVKILDGSGDSQTVLFTQTITAFVEKRIIDEATIIDISGTTIGGRLNALEAMFPVISSGISNGAVTTSKIAAKAATAAKLGDDVKTVYMTLAPSVGTLGTETLEIGQVFFYNTGQTRLWVKVGNQTYIQLLRSDDLDDYLDKDHGMLLMPTLESDNCGSLEMGQVFCYQGVFYLKTSSATPCATQTRLATYEDIRQSVNVTFMSEDGNTLLGRETTVIGTNAADPIGRSLFPTPTKSSTAQYTYTFDGWSTTQGGAKVSTALENIQKDTILYAHFAATVRNYNVYFYSGSTLLQTVSTPYGGTATYTGATPTNTAVQDPENYQFTGWSPSPSGITGNTSCYAQFSQVTPPSGGEITDSWATIAQHIANGDFQSVYGVGGIKSFQVTLNGQTETIEAVIAAFNHDDLASGGGKAPITFVFNNCLAATRAMNSTTKTYNGHTAYNAGGWSLSELRTWANGDFYNALPSDLKAIICEVSKKSDLGYYDQQLTTTTDKVFALCPEEVALSLSSNYLSGQGSAYGIFTDNVSRIKNLDSTSTKKWWWMRSSVLGGGYAFWSVTSSGNSYDYVANESGGVLLGFCINQ